MFYKDINIIGYNNNTVCCIKYKIKIDIYVFKIIIIGGEQRTMIFFDTR